MTSAISSNNTPHSFQLNDQFSWSGKGLDILSQHLDIRKTIYWFLGQTLFFVAAFSYLEFLLSQTQTVFYATSSVQPRTLLVLFIVFYLAIWGLKLYSLFRYSDSKEFMVLSPKLLYVQYNTFGIMAHEARFTERLERLDYVQFKTTRKGYKVIFKRKRLGLTFRRSLDVQRSIGRELYERFQAYGIPSIHNVD